jgi:hypothetical protein
LAMSPRRSFRLHPALDPQSPTPSRHGHGHEHGHELNMAMPTTPASTDHGCRRRHCGGMRSSPWCKRPAISPRSARKSLRNALFGQGSTPGLQTPAAARSRGRFLSLLTPVGSTPLLPPVAWTRTPKEFDQMTPSRRHLAG